MRKQFIYLLSIFSFVATFANAQIYLKKKGTIQQIYVENKPFLILGGELGNSSASSSEHMQSIWPKLKTMNINTVLAPVYWELMEPEEGKFDFALVDELIQNAKRQDMKLIFLWFGAWKNSMSCYAPQWIKKDVKQFPRALSKNGIAQEILSPFSENTLSADVKAFKALMKHIKEIDEKAQTVIMIQVENEIGMLPDAREYSNLANTAFKAPVPAPFFTYLNNNRNNLLPEIKDAWIKNGSKNKGNWEEVFGEGLATDEIFMAWYYAVFINKLADEGKAVYNIPMYLNAALNYKNGAKPGEYPSAGPLPHIMDVWKAGAPNIDLLSPDFYNPNFKYWNDLYVRLNNTLFIPEIKFEQGVAAKAFYALGHYSAMGFSPFSIENGGETLNSEISNGYKLLQQLGSVVLKYQGTNAIDGFLMDKNSLKEEIRFGDYILTFSHDLNLGWSSKSKEESWPITGALVIQIAADEFIVAGTGVVVTFKTGQATSRAGIIQIDEGGFKDGVWKPKSRLNGDENHQGRHLRIPEGTYSIQKVKLYTY